LLLSSKELSNLFLHRVGTNRRLTQSPVSDLCQPPVFVSSIEGETRSAWCRACEFASPSATRSGRKLQLGRNAPRRGDTQRCQKERSLRNNGKDPTVFFARLSSNQRR